MIASYISVIFFLVPSAYIITRNTNSDLIILGELGVVLGVVIIIIDLYVTITKDYRAFRDIF